MAGPGRPGPAPQGPRTTQADAMARLRRLRRTVYEKAPTAAQVKRRQACKGDLEKWLKTYLPAAFPYPFSRDQQKVIKKIHRALARGGLFCQAMPRGSGKTTIVQGAILYATLEGFRRYVVGIAADKETSTSILAFVKSQLLWNTRLHKAYPEICGYIVQSEGKAAIAKGQLREDGKPSSLEWKVDVIRLPYTLADVPGRGAVVQCKGLTGGIRGLNQVDVTGKVQRPDFVMLDDPQTRESANSAAQCEQRGKIITGDVMGLAGPGEKIAAVMNVTVIAKGDLAETFLDRDQHPEWQGERTKLVEKWPKAQETLWAEYGEIRHADPDNLEACQKRATSFYRKNRKAMDRGAKVAWPARKDKTDLSALQHAQNLLLDHGKEAFEAEYQNNPDGDNPAQFELVASTVAGRCNGRTQWGLVQQDVVVTGFIDINYSGLHWMMAAWASNLTGYGISYGKWPGGKRNMLYNPKRDTDTTAESHIWAGLSALLQQINQTPLQREGVEVLPDLVMVDCGKWMTTVFDWVRVNRKLLPFNVVPSRGFSQRTYKPTNAVGRPGNGWHLGEFKGKGRVICHNADKWRVTAQKAFLLEAGSPGSFSWWGKDPAKHRWVADHVCSEVLTDYVQTTEATYYTWSKDPSQANDLLDALVGNWVAASACGASPTLVQGRAARQHKPARQKRKSRVQHVPI